MAEATDRPSDWSELPNDLLTTIAKLLDNRIDNLRLRSVCASWRSSIPPFKNAPPLPLVLPFPVASNPALHEDLEGYYSLKEIPIYFLQPPPDENPRPTDLKSESPSPNGWLLRVEELGDGKFRPMNVLSAYLTERLPANFPKALNLLNFRIYEIGKAYTIEFVNTTTQFLSLLERYDINELDSMVFEKVAMSSTPWTADGDEYAVMAIHGGKLGFIKLRSPWISIDYPQAHYLDVVYFKGHFCAVDCEGRAVIIHTNMTVTEIPAPPHCDKDGSRRNHLVESCGDLYLVVKQVFSYNEIDVSVELSVFSLNVEDLEWEEVISLGDQVLFVGDDFSCGVLATDFGGGLRGNCVYFSEEMMYGGNVTDSNLGELCPDTCVYCFDGDLCGPIGHFWDYSPIFWNSPDWLQPNPGDSDNCK